MARQVSASIIELVDALLHKAIVQRASDIHLESQQHGLRVRFRIDGMLYDQDMFDVAIMHQIVSRIKVLANIDIAQSRIPQDGKFSLLVDKTHIDLRVSTFPTLHGQKVVIRILDPSVDTISIDKLAMDVALKEQFLALMRKAQGFFLVTGPTGSGKTTTLYAGLQHINTNQKNIITLEDPIEYHIEGITQGHIHPEAGFTFEKGMRALLRQDPDVVMVGEIRDCQTARIAIQAAMTGHLVLSTLHTNDASSVIMRLMDMGIEPFLLNASLSGVLAQRLVRLLCKECKKPRELSAREKILCKEYNVQMNRCYNAFGCQRCFNVGYKDRIAIFELLVMSDTLRTLISGQPSLDQIKAQAIKEGMTCLMVAGLNQVAQGVISFDELLRVV